MTPRIEVVRVSSSPIRSDIRRSAPPIDQVSVETAASGVDISVIEALRGKDVLLGVIDTRNETIESAGTVAGRLRAAPRYVEPGHLFACTDCGMMPLSRVAAEGKLRALAAGAALVNAEL